MKDGDVRSLLQDRLGLRKVRRNSSAWFNATCPFAGSRHQGGKDENPSFGVKVANERSSNFNCKGCHIQGDNLLALVFALEAWKVSVPVPLVDTFWWTLARDNTLLEAKAREDREERGKLKSKEPSKDYTGWKTQMLGDAAEPPSSPEGRASPLVPFEPPVPTVLPESDLAHLQLKPDADSYLRGQRRLLPATIAAWELGSRGNRVSIPIRDYKQRLVGISGRLLPGYTSGPKFLHSLGFRRDFFLYGESKVVEGRTGYVVEGFFNVIGLWQSGYQNAVAIMGSYPSKHQVEKMVKFFDRVVILGDGDKAGREMALKVLEAARPYLPASIVDIPDGKDPQDLTDEEKIQLLGPPDRTFDNRNAV
jgi:hypothetical protein